MPTIIDEATTAGMANAVTDVLAERVRQIDGEGFTPDKDDALQPLTLIRMALIYASRSTWLLDANQAAPDGWPKAPDAWKPGAEREMVVKAAALLLAHIERLDRADAREKSNG